MPQARGEDQLRLGVVDAGRKLLRGKAPEHHRMNRADARAGQHRNHGLRHHRHVDHDTVALGDAEILHHRAERLDLLLQLRKGERRDAVCQRRIVNERQLLGPPAFDVAIDRIETGIDDTARKPAAVQAHRWIKHFLRGLEPVDLPGGFRPESLRVAQRALMDFGITGFYITHRTVSGPRLPPFSMAVTVLYTGRAGERRMRLLALSGEPRHLRGERVAVFARHREVGIDL